MKIGILALQGAFEEHRQTLNCLGIQSELIRNTDDLAQTIDGLIIPGGESTVIIKLLHEMGLWQPVRKKIREGLPTFGTCAGMIVLAKTIENDSLLGLDLIDISVSRNAYGRQLGSFYAEAKFGSIGIIPMVLIRAPIITRVGKGVLILSEIDREIVAARQNHILVTSFHPELSDDTRVHEYFLSMICPSVYTKPNKSSQLSSYDAQKKTLR